MTPHHAGFHRVQVSEARNRCPLAQGSGGERVMLGAGQPQAAHDLVKLTGAGLADGLGSGGEAHRAGAVPRRAVDGGLNALQVGGLPLAQIAGAGPVRAGHVQGHAPREHLGADGDAGAVGLRSGPDVEAVSEGGGGAGLGGGGSVHGAPLLRWGVRGARVSWSECAPFLLPLY